MNLLIIGAGSGSWAMRGQQLGAAVGARVTSSPTCADWSWAHAVMLIKRYGAGFAGEAQRRHLPILWDAVDFWAQPAENGVSDAVARAMLAAQLRVIRPDVFIGSTEAMAHAAIPSLSEGHASVCLPHHTWRGLEPVQPQSEVTTVAYQGNPIYLGRWAPALISHCALRGWRFAVNPEQLWQADIVVALRDGPWDGWICREWKSGVKVGNAIAAGRPIITQDIAAVRELKPAGTVIASVEDLDAALDQWTPLAARRLAFECSRVLAPPLRLPAIADRFRGLLRTLEVACTTA